MSDTEYSVQERVETMYTVEVSAILGGNEGLQGGVDMEIYVGRKREIGKVFGFGGCRWRAGLDVARGGWPRLSR